jgi:hypothetical protein
MLYYVACYKWGTTLVKQARVFVMGCENFLGLGLRNILWKTKNHGQLLSIVDWNGYFAWKSKCLSLFAILHGLGLLTHLVWVCYKFRFILSNLLTWTNMKHGIELRCMKWRSGPLFLLSILLVRRFGLLFCDVFKTIVAFFVGIFLPIRKIKILKILKVKWFWRVFNC